MTNEEFERKMEFIVNQQAQFSADMLRLEAAQTELREAQARTNDVVARTNEVVSRLAAATLEGFKDTSAKINVLIDSHIRLQESDERLKESQERLSEAQTRTEESLKNLIATVESYLREKNGGTSGEMPA